MNKYIDALTQADSYGQIKTVAMELTRAIGCDYFMYAGVSEIPFSSPNITIIGNYPPEWLRRYEEKEYARIDPTVWHASHRVTPLLWRDVDMSDDTVFDFFQDAANNGVVSGVTLPLHSGTGYMALLTFVSSSQDECIYEMLEAEVPQLFLFGYHLHDTVIQWRKKIEQSDARAPLSEAEKKCLLWAAEGKTTWEIGQILSLKERTVSFHLNNATHKLGAANRQHAIACAIALGEIRAYKASTADRIEF